MFKLILLPFKTANPNYTSAFFRLCWHTGAARCHAVSSDLNTCARILNQAIDAMRFAILCQLKENDICLFN